jgi:hypothetical protein
VLGVEIVPVVHATPAQSRPFFAAQGLTFRAACSADGAAHRAFGLRRGKLLELLNFSVLRRGFEAFRKGFRQGKPAGDVRLLPGTFVVDAAGTLVAVGYGKDASDHWSADRLRAAL